MYYKSIITILLQILLTSTFICVYYFTVGLSIEKKIINNQIEYLVDQLMSNLLYIPSDVAPLLEKSKTANVKASEIKENNKAVVDKLKKTLIIFIVVVLSIIILVLRRMKWIGLVWKIPFVQVQDKELYHLLFENALTFGVVGITYVAVTYFATINYLSADPNYVKHTVIQEILNS